MRKILLVHIIFLSFFNIYSKENLKEKEITLTNFIIDSKNPIEIKDVTVRKESESFYHNNMPWIAALLIGVASAVINLIIAHCLRKSNEINMNKQIENAKEITLTQFKSTIATKNRQDWINEFRHSVSDFISYSTILMPDDSSPVKDDITHPIYEKFLYTKAKLEMLINPNKKEYAIFHDYLQDMLDILLLTDKDFNIEKFRQIRENIIKSSRTIIEIQWRKIKALS